MKKTIALSFVCLLALAASTVLTAFLIFTGVDWQWAVFFNKNEEFVWAAAPFVLVGMVVPIIIVFRYYLRFKVDRQTHERTLFYRSLYSFVFAYLCMTLLKVFTNRVDMEPFEPIGSIDTSNQFRFGFMNSNSWWESFSEGWPSGHTMIAVAMAVSIHPLIASSFWKWANILYPLLIGLSVSTAFHWLSDVLSGGLIGLVIGWHFSKKEY